jgi:serine kinase of HPr protein (carbohydrate metabolism regulator)
MALHATCVTLGERGVLITGAPGSGKSTLALRLMDECGRGVGETAMVASLVADDRVILQRNDLFLEAAAPASLEGLLEVRGIGILRVPRVCSRCRVHLVVRLDTSAKEPERLPAASYTSYLGIALPLIRLNGHDPAVSARLRAALSHAGRVE